VLKVSHHIELVSYEPTNITFLYSSLSLGVT